MIKTALLLCTLVALALAVPRPLYIATVSHTFGNIDIATCNKTFYSLCVGYPRRRCAFHCHGNLTTPPGDPININGAGQAIHDRLVCEYYLYLTLYPTHWTLSQPDGLRKVTKSGIATCLKDHLVGVTKSWDVIVSLKPV